jgi:hypothetical protein
MTRDDGLVRWRSGPVERPILYLACDMIEDDTALTELPVRWERIPPSRHAMRFGRRQITKGDASDDSRN